MSQHRSRKQRDTAKVLFSELASPEFSKLSSVQEAVATKICHAIVLNLDVEDLAIQQTKKRFCNSILRNKKTKKEFLAFLELLLFYVV